jgi:hypothetical protein
MTFEAVYRTQFCRLSTPVFLFIFYHLACVYAAITGCVFRLCSFLGGSARSATTPWQYCGGNVRLDGLGETWVEL